MVKIDVMGDSDAPQTMDVLTSLYANAEDKSRGKDSAMQAAVEAYEFENGEGQKDSGHSILIINGNENIAEQYLQALHTEDVVVMNSDDKGIQKHLNGSKARVITYGFNAKACVTASSVVENEYKTLQCCIQRSLMTFTGNTLEPQEFSVNIKNPNKNIYSVLAAVTAALVNDIPVETVAGTVIE